jgi:uncharacterized protein (TIGR02246 family)
VEVVRAAFAAIHEGDRQAAAALFTPDAEWRNTSSFPGPQVCVGADAIVDFYATLTEDFESLSDEIEQVRAVGDRVAVGFHQWGAGRQSGVPFDLRYAASIRLDDQRIARVQTHGGYEQALGAIGLRE